MGKRKKRRNRQKTAEQQIRSAARHTEYEIRKDAHISGFGNTVKKTTTKNAKKYSRTTKHKNRSQ